VKLEETEKHCLIMEKMEKVCKMREKVDVKVVKEDRKAGYSSIDLAGDTAGRSHNRSQATLSQV